jgi:hypothetical protein
MRRPAISPRAALSSGSSLVDSVGRLVDRAVDRVLLNGDRVTSAAEGRQRLAAAAEEESYAGDLQRVVTLAVPVVRRLARGARLARVPIPWVMVASTALSVGVGVSTGVRELRVLASLVAHRLEQETGRPPDPGVVKKLALELYLHPKRTPELAGGLPLVGLTRRWVLGGALGRDSSKRAQKALEAAERLDLQATAGETSGAGARRR